MRFDPSLRRAPTRGRTALRTFLAAVLALAATGCGGGLGDLGDLVGDGGGSDNAGGGVAAVTIVTSSLPTAGQGVPYTTTLMASGGTGPYSWVLSGGSTLPSGLSLASSGTISGTASTVGSYVFSVLVTDSAATPTTDSASYSLQVSTFAASLSVLRWGDAWTGESYPLGSVGGSNTTFTLVTNPSGGSIVNPNPSAGIATFVAGNGTGTDVIRASSTTGATQDITVTVYANPVGKMTARFSSTDVWHLRFAGKKDGSHPFTCDFDAALATTGMRSATGTDAYGSTADQLARAYVRQQTIRYLSSYYLNNEDGSAAANGLAISFPFDEPIPPHFPPADGAVNAPAANQFNVMSFLSSTMAGVVGTAYLDGTSNGAQENDTTTNSAGELGVFVDEIAYYFNSGYANTTLTASPVAAGDVPALKALLYGTASPGGRYAEIKRIGEGYGRTLAAVAAHEIGHSVGLNHTSPSQTNSIMNSAAWISPNAGYVFVASDVTLMRTGLPGPGRGGSPQTVESQWVGPDEGYLGAEQVVCGSCVIQPR